METVFQEIILKATASLPDRRVAGTEFFFKPFDPDTNVYGISNDLLQFL